MNWNDINFIISAFKSNCTSYYLFVLSRIFMSFQLENEVHKILISILMSSTLVELHGCKFLNGQRLVRTLRRRRSMESVFLWMTTALPVLQCDFYKYIRFFFRCCCLYCLFFYSFVILFVMFNNVTLSDWTLRHLLLQHGMIWPYKICNSIKLWRTFSIHEFMSHQNV